MALRDTALARRKKLEEERQEAARETGRLSVNTAAAKTQAPAATPKRQLGGRVAPDDTVAARPLQAPRLATAQPRISAAGMNNLTPRDAMPALKPPKLEDARVQPAAGRTLGGRVAPDDTVGRQRLPELNRSIQDDRDKLRRMKQQQAQMQGNWLPAIEGTPMADAREIERLAASIAAREQEYNTRAKVELQDIKANEGAAAHAAKQARNAARGQANATLRSPYLAPEEAAEAARLSREAQGKDDAWRQARAEYEDAQIGRAGKLTAGDRVKLGARSVGTTIGATPFAIWETGKQALKNSAAEWNDLERGRLRQEQANLEHRLLDVEYEHGVGSREAMELDMQINRIKAQLAAVDTNTPVDMDSAGMRWMTEGAELGDKAMTGLSEGQRFVGQTLMSVGQNVALMPLAAINPGLPLAAMSGVAAAGKMHELSAQGVGAEEAFLRGNIAGGIEALTEKLPLDSALEILQTGGRGALRNMLRQAGLEAGEEGISYFANFLADKVAGDAVDFSMAELLQSAAAGGLSGLFFGAGGSLINTGRNVAGSLPGNIRSQLADPRAVPEGLVPNLWGERPATLPDARARDRIGQNSTPEVEKDGQDLGDGQRRNAGGNLWGGQRGAAGVLSEGSNRTGAGQGYGFSDSVQGLGFDIRGDAQRLSALAEDTGLESGEPGRSAGGQGAAAAGDAAVYPTEARRQGQYAQIDESQEAFVARAAAERKEIYQTGDRPFMYTPAGLPAAGPEVSMKELQSMGVQAFIHDGDLETNRNGVTRVSHGEAATLPDGTVALRNDMTENPYNVAGHEMYHARHRTGGGGEYFNAIIGNVDYGSQAFVEYFDQIASNYYPGGFDYMTHGEKVWQEFAAYISGDMNQNANADHNSSLFRDWGAVQAAWQQMRDAGSQGGGTGQESLNGPRRMEALPRAEVSQELPAELLGPVLEDARADVWTGEGETIYPEAPTPDEQYTFTAPEAPAPGNAVGMSALDSMLESLAPQLAELETVAATQTPPRELVTLSERAKQAQRQMDSVIRRNPLTENEKKLVADMMRGQRTPLDIPPLANRGAVMAVYNARQAYEQARQPIAAYNARRRQLLRERAQGALGKTVAWEDKKAGLLYARETMERNIRDIAPNPEAAERMTGEYIAPVHMNEAARTKMKNDYRRRVRELDLSRRVAKGNADSEAAAVQFLGEIEDDIARLERKADRDARVNGRTLEEAIKARNKFLGDNPNLDMAKVEGAIEAFRQIYDELFEQMNLARVRNGYDPVDYRQGYFPHFRAQEGDGLLSNFARMMGINMEVQALPTSINGLTHQFRPGMRWFGNALQRTGNQTAYDAVEGFDRYIEGVSDVVHHTDDIQRLRALANEIRYQAGDEGVRAQVRKIMDNSELTEDERHEAIRKLVERAPFALSNFVVELDEYTNLLANKKAFADRNMERKLGRGMYNIVQGLQNRVAANMVAINPGSWLTNFIPLTQGGAEVGTQNLIKGMWGTLQNYVKSDGFVSQSDFLVNRRGSDPLVRTTSQSISNVLGSPMEMIDRFTADSLVRARYEQNKGAGMSHEAALQEADSWAAGVMADRSKGSMPTLFESKNPLNKLFTQFQLEVNNQLSYVFKDIPRAQRDKGVAAVAMALLRFAVGAWLFNDIYEYFVGRRPALDPLGMLNDTVGDLAGYALPSLPETAGALTRGELPSFKTEQVGLKKAGANLATNLLEEVPFVGGLMGGGRLPVSSAIPDFGILGGAAADLIAGENDPRYNWSRVGKELAKPAAYVALPFGGGQIKKTLEGVSAVARDGSYTVDKKGRDILRFPVSNDSTGETVGNYIRGAVFGRMAMPEAQGWVDSGFRDFSAGETAAYQQLLEDGASSRGAVGLLRELRAAEKTEEETRAQVRRDILADAALSDGQKYTVWRNLMASGDDGALGDYLTGAGEEPGAVYQVMDGMKHIKATKTEKAGDQKLELLGRSGLSLAGQAEVYLDTVASPEKAERYEALASQTGLTAAEFYEYQQGTKYMDGERDATGKTLDGTKAKAHYDYIQDMGLETWQETALYLSEVASKNWAEKYREKAGEAQKIGMDQNDLIGYMVDIGAMSSDKDAAGETISNSKRANVWAYIDALELTAEQKDFLHLLEYSESSLADAPWNVPTGLRGLRSGRKATSSAAGGDSGGLRAIKEQRQQSAATGGSSGGLRGLRESQGRK